ncbi:hypothetical protein E8E14_011162 [Neopestalotiopsis sp. 37M]|nr:hypothetical protein E8E14_011162 [Neopestalotiopsis sp. 37M]
MRTLMLHGFGTSAFIWKAQTGLFYPSGGTVMAHPTLQEARPGSPISADRVVVIVAFRLKLDDNFTFDFVDAPHPTRPPPGLNMVVSNAYTWYRNGDVDSVRASMDWLLDYIEKNGPYDNVCGFSQGCALVTSIILYYAREGKPLPFKSAVFVCGSINYSVLEDLGLPVSDRAKEIKLATENMVRQKAGALADLAVRTEKASGIWENTAGLLHNVKALPPMKDCFGVDFESYPADVFITIPTVHIYGAKDPICPSSIQLAYLCDPQTRKMYDHQGGHDVPRTARASTDIAALFKQLAKMI